MFDPSITHAYEIEDEPNCYLCIGVPDGQKRPAMWMSLPGHPTLVLARFHGDGEAAAAARFLDAMTNQINKVVTHLRNNPPSPETKNDNEDEGK